MNTKELIAYCLHLWLNDKKAIKSFTKNVKKGRNENMTEVMPG